MINKSIKEKYNLPDLIKVSVKKTESGFYAYLEDYPGCVTAAKNFGELIENVNDAILTYFDVPRKEARRANFLYLPKPNKKSTPATKKGKVDKLKPLKFTSVSTRFIYA